MFSTEKVTMALARATLRTIKDDRGVEHRVAECGLMIDPFGPDLGHELGEDVYSFLFDPGGMIRAELGRIVLNPRVPQSMASVYAAPDMRDAMVALRNVDVLALGVNVEEDAKSGERWLKATFKVRFGLAERAHREWLAATFGQRMCFSWEVEQRPLELGEKA